MCLDMLAWQRMDAVHGTGTGTGTPRCRCRARPSVQHLLPQHCQIAGGRWDQARPPRMSARGYGTEALQEGSVGGIQPSGQEHAREGRMELST